MFQPCLSVHGGRGVSCDNYPWCIGPHCTLSPPLQTMDITVQNTSSPHPPPPPQPPIPQTWDLIVQGTHASDIWWLRLEICSNLFTSGHLVNPSMHWTIKTKHKCVCYVHVFIFTSAWQYVYLSANKTGGSGWRKIVDFHRGIYITK